MKKKPNRYYYPAFLAGGSGAVLAAGLLPSMMSPLYVSDAFLQDYLS